MDHRPGAAAPADRHHRQHPPRRVLHRQALQPRQRRGRLGLLELRGFEMPPHFQMAMVQSLLVRSLVALVLGRAAAGPADPPRRQPARPIPVAALHHSGHRRRRRGPARARHRLRHQLAGPVHRVPLPAHRHRGVRRRGIELRGAIEPWNVLGEESTAGGTARYVDSSVERIQVRLIGADRHRYVVTVQRLSDTAAGDRQIPTSRSAACGSAPGSRRAPCTPPSPSTDRCASNSSTCPRGRRAAAARTTSPIRAAWPTRSHR